MERERRAVGKEREREGGREGGKVGNGKGRRHIPLEVSKESGHTHTIQTNVGSRMHLTN